MVTQVIYSWAKFWANFLESYALFERFGPNICPNSLVTLSTKQRIAASNPVKLTQLSYLTPIYGDPTFLWPFSFFSHVLKSHKTDCFNHQLLLSLRLFFNEKLIKFSPPQVKTFEAF